MQVAELFAPPVDVAAHPAVRAARELGAGLLEPHAAEADDPAVGVRRRHLEALAAAGLAAVTVPVAEGGLGAGRAVDTEVVELLSAACGATWFVLAQHRMPQRLTRGGLNIPTAAPGPCFDDLRATLARGDVLAGVATAHLRRPGSQVTAEPDPGGGYHLTGRVDWCSGWGLMDRFLVAGVTPTGRIVFGLVDAPRDGMRPTPPVPLSVLGGTGTVALDLHRCAIRADEVVLTVATRAWRDHDRAGTSNATPDSLGVLRGALVELERTGLERDRPQAVAAARALAEQAVPLRAEAYALLAEPSHDHLERRTVLRGLLAELTVRSAAALISATTGSAMLQDSPAQRWLREAAFHLVQAQTPPVRAAQLTALAERRVPPGP